jgi:hypothetical protein
MLSETPQALRERAEECERQAADVTSPQYRETLLFVAARWRTLADEDEKVLASWGKASGSAIPHRAVAEIRRNPAMGAKPGPATRPSATDPRR